MIHAVSLNYSTVTVNSGYRALLQLNWYCTVLLVYMTPPSLLLQLLDLSDDSDSDGKDFVVEASGSDGWRT
jgi:hypothetical protein